MSTARDELLRWIAELTITVSQDEIRLALVDAAIAEAVEPLHAEIKRLTAQANSDEEARARLLGDIYDMRDKFLKKEKQISDLRRQITLAQTNNHERNVELDALHYVWCSGGCKYGVHRWSENTITEELVQAAVRNTERLVVWWNTHERKKEKK